MSGRVFRGSQTAPLLATRDLSRIWIHWRYGEAFDEAAPKIVPEDGASSGGPRFARRRFGLRDGRAPGSSHPTHSLRRVPDIPHVGGERRATGLHFARSRGGRTRGGDRRGLGRGWGLEIGSEWSSLPRHRGSLDAGA